MFIFHTCFCHNKFYLIQSTTSSMLYSVFFSKSYFVLYYFFNGFFLYKPTKSFKQSVYSTEKSLYVYSMLNEINTFSFIANFLHFLCRQVNDIMYNNSRKQLPILEWNAFCFAIFRFAKKRVLDLMILESYNN